MPAAERAAVRRRLRGCRDRDQRPALASRRAEGALDHHRRSRGVRSGRSRSCGGSSSSAPISAATISCTARRRSGASAAMPTRPARAEAAWAAVAAGSRGGGRDLLHRAAGARARPTSSTPSPKRPRSSSRIGNLALRTMIDTSAAAHGRARAGRGARSSAGCRPGSSPMSSSTTRNRRGPGQGDDRFAPVLAALKRTGYDGWLAMEPFEYIPDGPTCAARVDRLCQRHSGGPRMNDAPRLKLVEVERFERDVQLRLPFRFGVITVTAGDAGRDPRHHRAEDGRTRARASRAETLAAKWFDKNPALSATRRTSTSCARRSSIAIELYRGARAASTPFGLYADTYREQHGARRRRSA